MYTCRHKLTKKSKKGMGKPLPQIQPAESQLSSKIIIHKAQFVFQQFIYLIHDHDSEKQKDP